MNDKTLVEMLAGWSDSEFAVAASGEYCEDLKSRIEGVSAAMNDKWCGDGLAETPDAVETGKLENIVRGLRQYPAEELAKHGITLAPEKDWATELWADLLEKAVGNHEAEDVRVGQMTEEDAIAIELLRTRFEQMKGED